MRILSGPFVRKWDGKQQFDPLIEKSTTAGWLASQTTPTVKYLLGHFNTGHKLTSFASAQRMNDPMIFYYPALFIHFLWPAVINHLFYYSLGYSHY